MLVLRGQSGFIFAEKLFPQIGARALAPSSEQLAAREAGDTDSAHVALRWLSLQNMAVALHGQLISRKCICTGTTADNFRLRLRHSDTHKGNLSSRGYG